jgi:hypothetical protein
MFTNKTVFILGAGASWHYGYPTGEDLVQKIISKSAVISEYFQRSAAPQINPLRPDYIARNCSSDSLSANQIKVEWETAYNEITELAKRLKQVNPLVIDYFLGQNLDLQPIGKLMIALIILECEAQFLKERGNENRRELLRQSPRHEDRDAASRIALQFFKDDWYRFVLHKLVLNCEKSSDLMKNNVRFVTFNYDVSLEYELDRGLKSISLFESEDIDEFLSGGRILHVYGQVRKDPSALPAINLNLLSSDRGRAFQYQQDKGEMARALKPLLDTAYASSKNLRVISPLDKDMDMKLIEAAKKTIAEAACVYVLGYGFDENNSRRLDLFRSLRLNGRSTSDYKAVLFTNYGDINRVNKKASELFMGNFQTFLPHLSSIIGDPRGHIYCEKSVRDVYEALELDFDALEDQLIGGRKI